MNNIALVPLIDRAASGHFPPLGVLYLARAVMNTLDGWNIDIVEQDPATQFYPNDFWDVKKTVEAVQRKNSDVVGISCFTITLPLAVRIAEEIKERDPTKVVILGGAGPSGVGEKILSRFPFVDFVVDGEGEISFVNLLNALDQEDTSRLSHVKSIVYRKEGKIYYTGPEKRIETLDELGVPAYELVDMKAYQQFGIIWHRGCPYNCSFCDVSQMWGRKVVSRSIDHVVEEIEMLKSKFGITNINFFDDTFTLKKAETVEMCQRLKDIDIMWSANCRIDTADRELLEAMADSGCRSIFYGIESGSNRILKMINKKITVDDVINVMKKTPPSLSIKASFIWNYPFETLDDFYKTFFFISFLISQGILTRYTPLSLLSQSMLYHSYKDKLVTDKDKNVQWNNMLSQNSLNMSGLSTPAWVNDMIFQHPDIFPDLLWVESPHVEEKVKFVRNYMQIMGQF